MLFTIKSHYILNSLNIIEQINITLQHLKNERDYRWRGRERDDCVFINSIQMWLK